MNNVWSYLNKNRQSRLTDKDSFSVKVDDDQPKPLYLYSYLNLKWYDQNIMENKLLSQKCF